jgi:hypothetical protein
MPGLQWARVDSQLYAHDKINALLDIEGGNDAFVLYVFALTWSVGVGTNGYVKRSDLRILRGDTQLAKLLVECELWDEVDGASLWRIHNFEVRQAGSDTAQKLSEAGRRGGLTTQQRRRDNALYPQDQAP